jgi:class 3 adenylate cyclase/tetratricopeptide (TPR) repeat protein
MPSFQAVVNNDGCELESPRRSHFSSIKPYLSDALIKLRLHASADQRAIGAFCEGTLLFADITGFTALSERLASVGREGDEELTARLNEYFEAMVEVIAAHGGDVLQFGGDSLLVLFAETQLAADTAGSVSIDAPCNRAAVSAVACALAMQEVMHRFQRITTSYGEFQLSMRIALHRGDLLLGSAGLADGQSQQIFVGPAVRRLAQIEGLAQAGQVLVSGEVGRQLVGYVALSECNGCFRVDGTRNELISNDGVVPAPPALPTADCLAVDAEREVSLVSCLIPAVYRRLVDAGQSAQDVGEHRYVTTMFVHFAGASPAAPSTADEAIRPLDLYLSAMGKIIHRHGGTLARVSADSAGERLLIFFGAPLAVERPEQRAMRCALEMNRRLSFVISQHDSPIEQRIAITSGSAFCGNVGARRRREYTVIGDHVNAACRLMGTAAPGEILVSASVRRASQGSFRFRRRQPLRLRGIEQPVQVHQLLAERIARSGGKRAQLTLVGRQSECTRLSRLIQRTLDGSQQIALLFGEPGVGKSRLVEEIGQRCSSRGMLRLIGQCDPYGGRIAYLPWAQILSQALGLASPAEMTADVFVQRLAAAESTMPIDCKLAAWSPLLGSVLGLAVAENEHTSGLEPRQRKEKLLGLCVDIVRSLCRRAPLVLVIEDMQWMDAPSRELLDHVVAATTDCPLFLLGAQRSGFEAGYDPLLARAERIELGPLDLQATVEMLQVVLGSVSVSDELVQLVHEKTRGNPLFVEELLRALIDARHLVKDEVTQSFRFAPTRDTTELPGTVANLILSRVDQLGEEPRRVIQIASIFGRSFRCDALHAALQFHVTPARFEATLREMATLDLIVEESKNPQPSYAFRHALVQEVVYESVAFSRRRLAHGVIGDVLERKLGVQAGASCEQLARHFDLAKSHDKAIHYLLLAGRKSKSVLANDAAADSFQRALDHFGDLPADKQDARVRLELLEELGDVHSLAGNYPDAMRSYSGCLEVADESVCRARLRGKLGGVAYRQGQPKLGIEHLDLGLAQLGIAVPHSRGQVYRSLFKQTAIQAAHTLLPALFVRERLRDLPATSAAIEIYESLSRICYESDLARTLDAHLRQLNVCEAIPGSEQMAQTYSSHGIVCGTIPLFRRALAYQRRGLEIRKSQSNRWGCAQSLNFMGISLYWMGRYRESLDCLLQSAEIFRDVGDRWESQVTYLILAFVKLRQGELAAALAHGQTCLELGQRADDAQGIGWALGALAEIANQQGQLADALNYAERALVSSRQAQDHMYLAVIRRTMAKIHLRMGQIPAAMQDASRSLQLIKRHRLRHEYVRGAASTMAEAYLAARESTDTGRSPDAAPSLKEIGKLAGQGVRQAGKYHNWLPYAYRVTGQFEWSAGRPSAAQRFFSRGVESATALGSEYELAMLHFDQARCGPADSPAARRSLLEAKRLFEKCGAGFDLRQVDILLESAALAPQACSDSASPRPNRRRWGVSSRTSTN